MKEYRGNPPRISPALGWNPFLHWVLKDHICIKCGGNMLGPYVTSVCPVESKPKLIFETEAERQSRFDKVHNSKNRDAIDRYGW